MIRLVITNGWSDLNAGDSAIIMSIIKRFQIEYGDNISISILSELCHNNTFFYDSIDKIREVFPNIKIELIPSPFYKVYNRGKIFRIKEIFSLITVFTKLIFLKRNYNNDNIYLKAIQNADVIVSKGGHFIYDRKGLNSIIHLLKCFYPIMVAKKLSKNYFFIAQSFGPFYNDNILSRVNSALVKYYLNNSNGVSVREKISYNAVKDIGIKEEILFNTSDYAFLINKIDYIPRLVTPITEKYMVITLRQHNYKMVNSEIEYLKTIKDICNYVYNEYGIKSLIVPHVKGPNDFENDIIITKKFEELLNKNEINNYIFNYNYLHAKELIELYSNAEILIGTRFHSVIFGLCKEVPSIAISYSGYKANIMKQFEMKNFMINIEEVNEANFIKMKSMVDELIKKNEYYRLKIQDNLKCVMNSILDDPAFKTITKVIQK